MAFSWEKQIENADKQKKRRDKIKIQHNGSFVAKVGKKKQIG